MSRPVRSLVAPALAVALAATGCTLGPDPTTRPAVPLDLEGGFVHAPEPADGAPADATAVDPWWTRFADPATTALVEQAFAANPDLAAAAARVAAAEAGLRTARSSLWPSADLQLSATRTKSSFVLPQTGRVGILSTTYLDELSVSYQVDLFGRLARTRQAAWAELLAARDARETVLHSIAAATVRSRVVIAGLEERLDLARATLGAWEDTAGLVERRYRHGLVGAVDVRLTRQSLESARAAVPPLEASLARTRHALDVLLGRRPGTGDPLPPLAGRPGVEPPPVGLPAALLDRRPDVRAAESRVQAATARIGISLANLFPRLTLSGSAGHRSDALDDLLSSDTLVYNAVAGLLTPVFSGGRLRADVAAARARADEAAADYAATILDALRDVEDALVGDDAARRRWEAVDRAAVEAREAARLALERYEHGTAPLLTFLEAERRRFASETERIAAREALWTTRIDLHLALGGDWSSAAPGAGDSPESPEAVVSGSLPGLGTPTAPSVPPPDSLPATVAAPATAPEVSR